MTSLVDLSHSDTHYGTQKYSPRYQQPVLCGLFCWSTLPFIMRNGQTHPHCPWPSSYFSVKWSYPPTSYRKGKPCQQCPDSNPTGYALTYSILFYSEDGCSLKSITLPAVFEPLMSFVLTGCTLWNVPFHYHFQLFLSVAFLISTFKHLRDLKFALFSKKKIF